MRTLSFNSIAWREGIASDEIGTAKNHGNTRRHIVWRRKGLGFLWTVIDDFGGVYGQGRCDTKKQGKVDAKPIVRPPVPA